MVKRKQLSIQYHQRHTILFSAMTLHISMEIIHFWYRKDIHPTKKKELWSFYVDIDGKSESEIFCIGP